MPINHVIDVSLGARSYPIIVGQDLLDGHFDLAEYVRGSDCLVVSNDTVAPLYMERLLPCLGSRDATQLTIADGEAYKTMATVQRIIDELVSLGANRDTTVVALGGGVVGDIVGFAAACYMRGVAFIQVPTTLLAQVDSSVGGKTGVNHDKGKNLIGAFHQPQAVLIDTNTLGTLPDRELRAGLAEVIKYGAICDRPFFDWLEANIDALQQRDAGALAFAIRRSCELKAAVVAEDELEHGRRAILNFGHTFGHAIERCQGYGDWLHGEAVAAGMMMAAQLSDIDPADVKRLRDLVVAAGLPAEPPPIPADAWQEAMGMDKKVQAKQLRFVLLRALGSAFTTSDYDRAALRSLTGAA